MLTGDGETDP